MNRQEAIETLIATVSPKAVMISALGYITRDLYKQTSQCRERCFYNLGAMGGVIPLALGVAISRPAANVYALEGDGSMLMNLGGLVSLRRYGSERIVVIAFDNRCYESTGGQPSQPDGFELEDMVRASGVETVVATTQDDLCQGLLRWPNGRPRVIVAKVSRTGASGRFTDTPPEIARRFTEYLSQIFASDV